MREKETERKRNRKIKKKEREREEWLALGVWLLWPACSVVRSVNVPNVVSVISG